MKKIFKRNIFKNLSKIIKLKYNQLKIFFKLKPFLTTHRIFDYYC